MSRPIGVFNIFQKKTKTRVHLKVDLKSSIGRVTCILIMYFFVVLSTVLFANTTHNTPFVEKSERVQHWGECFPAHHITLEQKCIVIRSPSLSSGA